MQFGMPTLIENRNLEEVAILCSELELKFIELNMNLPQYQVDKIAEIQDLMDIATKYNVYYTIHLDENLNVCDFNEAVARAYLDTVKSSIHIAKKLNIPILNMHMNPGIYFTLPDKKIYLFEQYKEMYLGKIIEFRNMCEREIGDEPILISVENTDGYLSYQKEAIEILLESKVFSLTWDIGHSFVVGNIDESFIINHENRLKHFHIHDAKNLQNHLTLGTGEIKLQQKLSIADRNNCRGVVETKTIKALKESVIWLQNHQFL